MAVILALKELVTIRVPHQHLDTSTSSIVEAQRHYFLFMLKSIEDQKHLEIMAQRKRTEANLPHHFPHSTLHIYITTAMIRCIALLFHSHDGMVDWNNDK